MYTAFAIFRHLALRLRTLSTKRRAALDGGTSRSARRARARAVAKVDRSPITWPLNGPAAQTLSNII